MSRKLIWPKFTQKSKQNSPFSFIPIPSSPFFLPLCFTCAILLWNRDCFYSVRSIWQEYFSQLQDTTHALPCHIHLSVCLWILDPHSRAPKKNTSHGNEVLPQDTTLLNEALPQDITHLIQRPCYQRGSPCQDAAGNLTTRRPPDHCKETQTAVVGSCLLFIRSGQNHLTRHSEREKKTRQTKEEVGRQHQGMDRSGVRQVPEGSWEQGKMDETGCEIICDAPTTLAVKG